MIQFDLARFKGVKYSLQDLSFDNRLTLPIGKVVPVGYEELFPGEEADVKVQQLTRFMPMPAPLMQRFDVYIDAHFVPYRILKAQGFDSEKYFNYRLNSVLDSQYSLPLCTGETGLSLLAQGPGSLPDYLGLPTLSKAVFNEFKDALVAQSILFVVPMDKDLTFDGDPTLIDPYQYSAEEVEFTSPAGDPVMVRPFGNYLLEFMLGSTAYADLVADSETLSLSSILTGTNKTYTSRAEYEKDIISFTGKSLQMAANSYVSYVYSVYFGLQDTSSYVFNVLPFWVYHRIIADWYINTNFQDPETYLASHLVLDSASDLSDLAQRYWAQDYFTSCFTTPQVGNAVRIPANGTISDLRTANSIQKMLERALYTGKRYIEQVRSFFGAHSSDARFDRTEVLGRRVYRINMNDVTQTNQADFEGMLSTPVGQVSSNGISVAGDHLCHYKAEEHGMIMFLMSVRPKAAYFQGFRRIFLKRDLEEFLTPDLAQVGEQPIYKAELFFDPQFADTPTSGSVFGFNRRYAEYLYHPSEVHGEFRTTMDYWHAARRFDGPVVLNEDFLKVTDSDNVERIFNVPSEPGNVCSWLYFDVKVSRALPRYIDYDL